jgi:hypothetical protein
MPKRKQLSLLPKPVPKENHGKKLHQIFHGGPWDGDRVSAWPAQVHNQYPLEHGSYVRASTIDTQTERHYRWIEKP